MLASDEWMLKVVANGMIAGESKVDYQRRLESKRSEDLREKKLHGKFFRDTDPVADARSWQWMSGGFLDKRAQSFASAPQENVLSTRCYNVTILKQQEGDQNCRLCGSSAEIVGHLISACDKLAHRDYKRRHDRRHDRIGT